MTPDEIRNRFTKAFNGHPNFLTPEIIRYGKKGEHLFEISTGRGLGSGHLYGVTVITVKGERCHELSKCFDSLQEAHRYAKTLPRIANTEETNQ
jgi:hypothetical protein